MTALPYHRRPAPDSPGMRPAYQGSNPISRIWASECLKLISQNLQRVLDDPEDEEARGQILLGATYAGIGFEMQEFIFHMVCPIQLVEW